MSYRFLNEVYPTGFYRPGRTHYKEPLQEGWDTVRANPPANAPQESTPLSGTTRRGFLRSAVAGGACLASSGIAPLRAHGGEGWLTELMDAGGGLMATASAVVQLIGRHAVWGLGGRAANYARSGSMAGTSSMAVSRGDGVDYCFIFNTREFPSSAGDVIGTLKKSIDKALDGIKLS